MAASLLGESSKTATLFLKAQTPKNGKTGILFLGNKNLHFTGTPKNKLPKVVFEEISMFRGKPDYPLRAIFHILSPFLPKINREQKAQEIPRLNSIRIYT
jgi:hypothetical protein